MMVINMKNLSENIMKNLKESDSSAILDSIYAASEVIGEDPDYGDVIDSILDKMSSAKFKQYLKDNGMTEDEFYDTAYEEDPDSVISGLEEYLDKKSVKEIAKEYEEIAEESDDETAEDDYEEEEPISPKKVDKKISLKNLDKKSINKLNLIAKNIENILLKYSTSSNVVEVNVEDGREIFFGGWIVPAKFGRKNGNHGLHGRLYFDKNIKLIKVSAGTGDDADDILNYNYIKCITALYEYLSTLE